MESSIQETEELRSRTTSVSLENSALEKKLQGLRQEKEQLQAELKDKMEELHTQVCYTLAACWDCRPIKSDSFSLQCF